MSGGHSWAIEAAARLISDKGKWTTGTLARNRKGLPAHVSRGVSFDATGALMRVCGESEANARREGFRDKSFMAAFCEVQMAACGLFKMSLERVNDELGHKEVLEVFRHAWKRSRLH